MFATSEALSETKFNGQNEKGDALEIKLYYVNIYCNANRNKILQEK